VKNLAKKAPASAQPRPYAGQVSPFQFHVSRELRRAFKVYAAEHDLKLNVLFERMFEAYMAQHGD